MPSEMTLKIFAYNVQMRDQLKLLEYHNKERARLIAETLARSDYDVLVFSEAFDNKARKEMMKILGPVFKFRTAVVGNDDDIHAHTLLAGSALLGAVFGGSVFAGLIGLIAGGGLGWITGRPKSDGGVFIMSRWPIHLQGQIIYKESAGEDRFGRKGVTWALVHKQGFFFNVFGTHTQADARYAYVRELQLRELAAMHEALAPNWQPTLIAGDLNVDYCFDRDRCPGVEPGGDCCDPFERNLMLATLEASTPPDLTRFTYTSDPSNDMREPGGTGRGKTLDYVLHSSAPSLRRPQPLRASLETVRPRGVFKGRERDLSDHFGVLGTYTFPFVREDSQRFGGAWRCVLFNGQPDTHNHRLTLTQFGRYVLNEFDGERNNAQIFQLHPGAENSGRIVFRNLDTGVFNEYEYAFAHNDDFARYFIASQIQTPWGQVIRETRPRRMNELLLRNEQRTVLYAFESWPAVALGDDYQPGGPV